MQEEKKEPELITIEKEKVQTLITYFWEASGMCRQLNIYEHPDDDEYLRNIGKEVEEIGRSIK